MLTPVERRKRLNRICSHGYDTRSCPVHKWDVKPVTNVARGEEVGRGS